MVARSQGAGFMTPLTRVLDCAYPIISAGMGGPARSELAAAVSAAGGFGLLGMVRESPELIAQEIAAVRQRTDRPFGVNLIPFATAPDLLEAELQVCFAERVPAMCYFWQVYPDLIARTKQAGCKVLYQVGTLEDAVAAADAGADAIIVQGVEAGGHVRGSLPLMELLPAVAKAVKVPIAASGGIVDGVGLAASLAMGAHGVHCGTVFLATPESFAHDYHKQRIVEAGPEDTVHTDLFAINWPPHSPVRVLKNSVTAAAGDKLWGYLPDKLPREEIGRDDGRPIWKFSTDSPLRSTTGDFEKMSLFAGRGAGTVSAIRSADEVITSMMEGAVSRLQALAGLSK
ncbi:MAG: nitronate monooxygenase [Rhodospirillaceae bacterium]|nr:MAG: nitronate monooxygenase [Rhodospirillaceae bacterium]